MSADKRSAEAIVKGIQRNPELRQWFGPHAGEDAADHFWQHSALLGGEEVDFTGLPGAELLELVAAYVRRYVLLSDTQTWTTTLWALHSHAMEAAEATPYL